MKKVIYILISGLLVLNVSCSDLLDKDPVRQMGAGEYFDSETSLKVYANGFMVNYIPTAAALTRGDQYSDICVTSVTEAYLRSGYTPLDAANWGVSNWSQLHNVNYFLAHMWEAENFVNNEATMRHYEGVGRFWRAWFYWNKVKTFGDVPWYDKPIDAGDEEMLYKGRDSRDYVMGKVLEDLNYAATYCSDDSKYLNKNVVNRYVALALKSRICLYEGTYRKYHSILGGDLWLDECVSACEDMMNNSPYALYTGAGEEASYGKLFKSLSPVYAEVILSREMSEEETVFNDATWFYASASYGNRNSTTKSLVNMYLNLDGTRFTDRTDYNKVEFKNEFVDRDYRLKQTIITPGYSKTVSGTLTDKFSEVFPNLGSQLTYYRIMKWNVDNDSYENTSVSNNSLCVFRYGEILLNYAEAKAELGKMGTVEWNRSVRPLRERSGVNGREPESADPYLSAYYGGLSDKWILEVRRERTVEMFMENVRRDDLMRWRMGHKLDDEFDGIYIPVMGKPFDLDGDGKNDLCFYSTSSPRPTATESGVTYVQITEKDGDAATTFGINADGCLVYKLDREWKDYKYLYPIPETAININPDLGQNPGWDEL